MGNPDPGETIAWRPDDRLDLVGVRSPGHSMPIDIAGCVRPSRTHAPARSGAAHDTSERTPDHPPDSEGGIPRAHSPTATTPVFRVDTTTGSPPSAPSTRDGNQDSNKDSSSDDEPDPFTQARKRRWAELIRHVWLDDAEVCEQCGGRMRIAGVCTSPRDDDAIRRELEARDPWDPPWARAPPPSEGTTTMSRTPSDPSSPHPLPADPAESTHPSPTLGTTSGSPLPVPVTEAAANSVPVDVGNRSIEGE